MSPGGGIDDLQTRYSELTLVTLRPHYDLVTLMDHIGSSLWPLGGRSARSEFSAAGTAAARGDAEPQRFVSSHLNSAFALCDRPLLKADPCKPW